MKAETIYRKVSVDERLPDASTLENVFYDVVLSDGKIGKAIKYRDGTFKHQTTIQNDKREITHWIKEQPNIIVLCKEELLQTIKDFNSWLIIDGNPDNLISDNLNDFLNSKLNP